MPPRYIGKPGSPKPPNVPSQSRRDTTPTLPENPELRYSQAQSRRSGSVADKRLDQGRDVRIKPKYDYMNYRPEGWNQVMYTKRAAARLGLREPYEMSYWENPLNVARNYWAMKSRPPGTPVPDFLDEQQVNAAYKYMTYVQGTDDWANWKYLNPEDPTRYYLQSMPQPPMEWQLSPAKFQQWLAADLSGRDPDTWTDEELAKLTPQLQDPFMQYRQQWRTKVPFEDLPMWQQLTYRAQQNPVMSGVSTMIPFALAGGAGGLATGGPIGGIIGAGVPLLSGAALGALSAKYPSAAELLQKLDVPAQYAEQALGVGLQMYGSMVDEETYGALDDIMSNLPAAWEAGGVAYDVGAGFESGADLWDNTYIPGVEVKGGRLDITNIFPAIEYGIRYITDNDPDMIKFAGPKQVFPSIDVIVDETGQEYAIGGFEPINLDVVGVAALRQARERMVNGEDPDAVIADYQEQFGFSGEFADLAGHIALDPLNVLPKFTSKGIGVLARAADNMPAFNAFWNADGPVRGWKTYQNAIRQGLTGAADEVTAFNAFVAGLDQTGVIKELQPQSVSGSPIKRWLVHLATLTPEAKGRTILSMSIDNLMNLIEYRRGDPIGTGKLIRQMINESPTKMAETAKFLGSPEWATVRQALVGVEPKLAKLEEVYVRTERQRVILSTIKDITGLDEVSILKLAKDTDNADNLFKILKDKAAAIGDDRVRQLAENTTTKELKQIMDVFGGDNPAPWHPDEYAARVANMVGEHVADWAIENYGITKPDKIKRFWNTMKRAQSVVLLGFNPGYAINNIVNNTVTRAATGIWGYATPAKIDAFWADFGYKPYRLEAGTGVGEAVSNINLKMPGEEKLRVAVTPERSGKVRGAIDTASELGLANKLSGLGEKIESVQSYYTAVKKYLNNNWKRRRGFDVWSEGLTQTMREAYPGIRNIDDAVYSIIEGSPNRRVAEQRVRDLIAGKGPSHDLDIALGEAARRLGEDPAMIRDTMELIIDDLRNNLEGVTDADGYNQAYTRTRQQLQERILERLSEDLQTRFEQVTTQTGSGSFAEVSRIYAETQLQQAEFWLNHFEAWDKTINEALDLRASGGTTEAINALYADRRAEANALWDANRKFEKATWLGFLEAMGAEDPEVRSFLAGMDTNATHWDEYFKLVDTRQDEYWKMVLESGEKKKKFRQEWLDMYMKNQDDYLATHNRTRDVQIEMDRIFVEQNRRVYGDEAAAAAARWRNKIRNLHDVRVELQVDHRKRTIRMAPDKRRVANQKFYNEKYTAIIKELYRNDIEFGNLYSRTVAGDIPAVEFTREMGNQAAAAQAEPQGAPPPGQEPIQGPPPEMPPEPPIPPKQNPNIDAIREIAKRYGIGSDMNLRPDVPVPDSIINATLNKWTRGAIDDITNPNVSAERVAQVLEARKDAKSYQARQAEIGKDFYGQDVTLTEEQTIARANSQVIMDDYISSNMNDLDDQIFADYVKDMASTLLADLYTGQVERIPHPDKPGVWITRTSNMQWYSDIPESMQSKPRIAKALTDIISGKGKPRANATTMPYLKNLIMKFLETGYGNDPAAPYILLKFGEVDEAAAAFRQHVESDSWMSAASDADLIELAGSLENLEMLWDRAYGQIESKFDEPQTTIPTPETAPAVEDLLAMYQAKQEDLRRMQRLAKRITGVTGTSPIKTGREIVPVGEQGLTISQFSQKPHGHYPPGAIESIMTPQYTTFAGVDFYQNKLRPVLDTLQEIANEDVRAGKIRGTNLDAAAQAEFNKWMNGVWGDMATHKIAATRYGEMLRDEALLNYSRKRGIDESFFVSAMYPYQYWYTRSMMQWALRAVDRPAWFANYSRIRNFMSRKQNSPGFPSRLRGKISIPAPYLPEWAGNEVWVDPVRKLFPIEEFTNVIDQNARQAQSDERSAEYFIVQQYNEGNISQQAALKAFRERSGPDWDMAIANVHDRNEAENAHPESWITSIMSPAAYLTYPYALLTGKDPFTGQEPGQLPITRTGMALQTVTEDTPLQGLGKLIGGVMSAPEKYIRGARGLSEFGGWGEYYLDRQVANMVAEGELTSQEGQQLMIDRSGPKWEEVRARVQFEQMLKVPGALPMYAATHGGGLGGTLAAGLLGWLPASLYPEGELIARGLKDDYDAARSAWNAGDETAMQRFFDENPKYEARLALYKEPEERLRNFLISNMWDAYGDLSGLDKKMVREEFGPLFEQGFLNDETSNYDMLDNETLSVWLNMLGRQVPESMEIQGMPQDGILYDRLQFADPNDAALMDAYKSERNQLFPNWYALQQRYYAIPKGGGSIPGATDEESAAVINYRADRNSMFPGWFEIQTKYFELPQSQRKAFLNANPMLSDYWSWNKEQKKANPAIEKFKGVQREGGPRAEFLQMFPELPAYWDWNSSMKAQNPQIDYYTNPDKYDDREPPPHAAYDMGFVRDFSTGLTRQLFDYYYGGQPMSSGTQAELMQMWEANGSPGMDYEQFVEYILRGVVAP